MNSLKSLWSSCSVFVACVKIKPVNNLSEAAHSNGHKSVSRKHKNCIYLCVILQNVSGERLPGPPRIIVPSAFTKQKCIFGTFSRSLKKISAYAPVGNSGIASKSWKLLRTVKLQGFCCMSFCIWHVVCVGS